MKRGIKFLYLTRGIPIILFGALFIYFYSGFKDIFALPAYDAQDLIDNYEAKTSEILDVKKYIDFIVPPNTEIDIEFQRRKIPVFHVVKDGLYDSNWDLQIHSPKVDSLLTKLGWNHEDLEILRQKLKKANCISVASGNPVTIGWQRSGLGKFYYKIFDHNLSDSLADHYNDGCRYIFYKDNVVLEYGGGATGLQCFPGYQRKPESTLGKE